MRQSKKTAFTLVELLVVIGIIATLIAILLPALSRAQSAAKGIACQSNMRQLALAVTMYANENYGWYPPNDSYWQVPGSPSWYAFPWYTPPILGKYVNNTSWNPFYTTTRSLFCPALAPTTTSSTPRNQWNADFGIGYNASTSVRNNNFYHRYAAYQPTDPSYAAAQANLDNTANRDIALLGGRTNHPEMFLLFVDVSSSSNRFIQLFNGAAATLNAPNTGVGGSNYVTNPNLEAISYRHNQYANVAFLDGHVESFHANQPDDNVDGTHKNDGIHAEWLAGRIHLNARGYSDH